MTNPGLDQGLLSIEDRLAQCERLLRHQRTVIESFEHPEQILSNLIYVTSGGGGWGPTNVELLIATLEVPTFPYPTIQYPYCQTTLFMDTAGDNFTVYIKENDLLGTVINDLTTSAGFAGSFASVAGMPTTGRSIVANTTATYVLSVAKFSAGPGTVAEGAATWLGCLVIPVQGD